MLTVALVSPAAAQQTRTVISETFTLNQPMTPITGGTWSYDGARYNLGSPAQGTLADGEPGNVSVHPKVVSGDFTLTARGATQNPASDWEDFAIVFNYRDESNYHYVIFNEQNNATTSGIFRVSGGVAQQLADITATISGGVAYSVKVVRSGASVGVYRDGVLAASITDTSFFSGKVGFATFNDAAWFDSLIVAVPSCLPTSVTDPIATAFTDCGRQVPMDTAPTEDSALPLWGLLGCEEGYEDERVGWYATGGDTHLTAYGQSQGNSSYRRTTALDGDDFYGERCELGLNDHRYGEGNGGTGTFTLYGEGQRSRTFLSLRLPENYPLHMNEWQVVTQIKQTQPADMGIGTPVLSLEARANQWRLVQSTTNGYEDNTRVLWSTPAQKGVWTRFAFDVRYHQDASLGSVKLYVDLNNDGDSADAGERYVPTTYTFTLKRERAEMPPADPLFEGESVPSHLRIGIYHNPVLPSASLDIDNVQVIDR